MPLFLIAPLAAVGLFLLKMVVAAGYVVTGQWAALPDTEGEPGAAVVIAANAEPGTPGQMSLALADGRTFTGALVFTEPHDARVARRFDDIVDRRTRNRVSRMVQPVRQRRAPSKPVAVVELADSGGASMRCAFFVDRTDGAAGLCTDDHGRWFDLARIETAPNAG